MPGPAVRRLPIPVPAALLRIDPARVDAPVRRFRCQGEHADRVRVIARTFLHGYNTAAGATRISDIQSVGQDVEEVYRPFFFEGACMGYGPYALRHGHALGAFESYAFTLAPHTRYQNYVGFGWWLAMVPPLRRRILRVMDFRYRDLCFEGAGFMAGFFGAGDTGRRRFRRRASASRSADHAWLQGYGRALWFVHMGDIHSAIRHIEGLPPAARGDLYSGLGLGVGFSWLDRASSFAEIRDAIPGEHRAEVEQGMAFGLEARAVADPVLFDALLPPDEDWARPWRELVVDVRTAHHDLLADGPVPDFYLRWRSHMIRSREAQGRPPGPASSADPRARPRPGAVRQESA